MEKSQKKISASAIRFLAAGILVIISLLAMVLFSQVGKTFFPAYRQFSCAVEGALANVMSVASFALWDWILIALIVGFIVWLVVVIVKRKGFFRWLSSFALIVAVVLAAVVFFWGLNHYAPSLADELGMQVGEYSAEELEDATQYYLDWAGAYAGSVPREANGSLVRQDFDQLATIAGKSYEGLSSKYAIFSGSTKPVKKLVALGPALLYSGHCGIFCPVTGEASVPQDCAIAEEPFVMCHEAAHRCGIASEEEANFAAFLACERSGDNRFRYAGYYSAFCYCYNALASNYPARAKEFIERNRADADQLIYPDINDTAEYYDTYSGLLEEAGTAANDAYLKAFNESDGIKSYGLVVDYLIAYNQ